MQCKVSEESTDRVNTPWCDNMARFQGMSATFTVIVRKVGKRSGFDMYVINIYLKRRSEVKFISILSIMIYVKQAMK